MPEGHARSSRPPSRPACSSRTTATTRRCPSPAVCRMCLVEVEKAPKLMPACVTTVAEGQVVHVNSAPGQGRRARACSSSCSSTTRSTARSATRRASASCRTTCSRRAGAGTRYDDYAKRYNPVEDFGPDILYVPNRCILCTRCVRFMDDVAEDAGAERLGARRPRLHRHLPRAASSTTPGPATWWTSARSARSSRRTSCTRRGPGTSTDARASAPAARQGCNITIDTRDNMVVRLRPRPNLEVNRHFMCDDGPDALPLDEPRRPDRGAAGPRGRPARGRRLGHRPRRGWPQVTQGGAGSAVAAGLRPREPRVARLAQPAARGATR